MNASADMSDIRIGFLVFLCCLAVLGIIAIGAVVRWWYTRDIKKAVVNCSDLSSAIAEPKYQVAWRVTDREEIDFNAIELYSMPEQLGRYVDGITLLRYLQRNDVTPGCLMCPYPVVVASAVVIDDRLYPKRWACYRVWFFVPVWLDEPPTMEPDSHVPIPGRKGLHVYGLEHAYGKVELVCRPLTGSFGPSDVIAMKKVIMPAPKAELAMT